MLRSNSVPLALVLLSSALPCQYATHKVDTVGIQVRAHKDLTPVPLKLGSRGMTDYMRAQFMPASENDYIVKASTMFDWGMRVLEFGGETKAPITGKREGEDEGEETEASRTFEEMMNELRGKYRSKNFLEYVTEKDPLKEKRTFVVKGKTVSKRGKRPEYLYYEFYDEGEMIGVRGTRETFYRYRMVACYTIDSREIVLYFNWPLFKKPKPDLKFKRIAKRMIESLELLDEDEIGKAVFATSSKKDKYANTPERKAALDKALENIKSLKGWDYLTSPNYIVLYSWDGSQPTKKAKSLAFARTTVRQMEEVRELYTEHYPPHEGLLSYYPVLRICHTKDLFDTYGGTSGGVVGWFNPSSKELVIFYDQDSSWGGKDGTKATSFHEGWHQYADAYFGEATLHRWFDEGTGDWFGAWDRNGARWTFAPDKSRIGGATGIQMQVRRKAHVPLKEIISWNTDKFYGPKALYYYAQGYAMVDFLRRGKKALRGSWDKSWDNILDNYRKTLLKTKDQKKALEAAYGNVDMDKLDEAFQEYVLKHISKH